MIRVLLCCFLYLSTYAVYAQELPSKAISASSDLEKDIEKLLDSSTVRYEKGDFASSLKLNIEAIEKSKEIKNNRLLSKAYRYVAYDYLILKDTALARSNFENSREYAVLSNNSVRIGKSYMDLANFYSSGTGEFKKAGDYYDKAIVFLMKLRTHYH